MTTDTIEEPPAQETATTRSERVGWYFYDWAASAFNTTVVTVFLGPYLLGVARTAAGCPGDQECDGRTVNLFGFDLLPGSVFPLAVSVSVFLTVFVLPVVGAIADRSAHKKQLLALFAYVGAAATVANVFVAGTRFELGAVLLIVANVAFGASIVIYNSFLPQIAGPDERDAVSSRGWAIGYLGGGLLLALNVVAVFLGDTLGADTADIARYCIASAGLWWAGFTTIPLLRLRNRPPVEPVLGDRSVIVAGFVQLGRTLKGMRAFPLTLGFLAAYLVYNDGIQTVITLASVYGTDELKLPAEVLVSTILMVQFLAFAGALALGALARRIGAWKTVLGSLVLWTVVLALAYFLPARQPLLFIALGGLIGIVLGGSQALSRSLFSQLIPRGKEAEYFGFYEISDKGTSWLGPLLFALAYQLTGSYRVAIISLVAFFAIGFLGLLAVPMRRAIEQAGNVPPRVL
ncbi:MAG TPA: MFS transporter [Cryptosporangiaceae bacterium]|nr:MFS transporter [Cryptosporangiaceae bacterium]